jgi:UDP-N-acetylmuramoyl-tripeptide--D-alanyl-D-alanine ligase
MRRRTLAEVATATGGTVDGDLGIAVDAVVTDSRGVEPGALFVALHGERFDGHDFVGDAFARGAAAALVRREAALDGPCVRVDDTGDALLALAADERAGFDGEVVAITGANGKTTTKDMAAAVLSARHRTHASPSSFNNEVGLPMTLLGAPDDAAVIVAELGARRTGDVARLCRIAEPRIAVVTNVGVAHMEVFGSWDAIVAAGAEPVVALPGDGVAVLNADDPATAGYRDLTDAHVLTFGLGEDAAVRARGVRLDRDGRASFEVVTDDGDADVALPVPGEHMVGNALAAVAVGASLGVPVAEAAAALGTARITPWRMEAMETPRGVGVLNDAYNANPESMAAALKTARWMAGDGRLIAVLGQMAELGDIADVAHERVGELAARLRVDRLVTIGPDAAAIAVAAVREGIDPHQVAVYEDLDLALDDVVSLARSGDVVLVKGSRVAGLEVLAARLAEALT